MFPFISLIVNLPYISYPSSNPKAIEQALIANTIIIISVVFSILKFTKI